MGRLFYCGLSEVRVVEVSDSQLNDRSGWVYVPTGKGMKPRSIPLSVHVRKALQAYLNVRPNENEEGLFIGQRGPLLEWGDSRRRKEVRISGAAIECHRAYPSP